jgi:hypothetical protein
MNMNQFLVIRIRYTTYQAILWFTISIGAVLTLSSCAVKLEKYTAMPANSYSNIQNKNGLALAVHPLINDKESEKYFGFDLISKNILAIFVAAENKNPLSSFIISADKFFMSCDEDEKIPPASSSPYSGNEAEAKAAKLFNAANDIAFGSVVGTLFVPLAPAALLVATPLGISGEKQMLDSRAISFNFSEQEFVTRTLSPSGRAQGFFYFRVFFIRKESLNCVCQISVKDTITKEDLEYDFPLVINKSH